MDGFAFRAVRFSLELLVGALGAEVAHGAAFDGVAALLGMMTSCASGVSVVNIDNGFGAGFLANRINRL